MAESVFGKPVDNAVKEIGEQISALNSNLNLFADKYNTNTFTAQSGSSVVTSVQTTKSAGFVFVIVPTSATTANTALIYFIVQNGYAIPISIKELEGVSYAPNGSKIDVTTTTSYGANIRLFEFA